MLTSEEKTPNLSRLSAKATTLLRYLQSHEAMRYLQKVTEIYFTLFFYVWPKSCY